MKKYLLGIIAVAMTVGALAFKKETSIKEAPQSVTFYYDSDDFSAAEVQKKENWVTTIPEPNCTGLEYKACTLVIDALDTDNSGPGGTPRMLNDITVLPGAGGSANGHIPNPATTGYISSVNRQ